MGQLDRSQMQELAQSPRGRACETQQDLLDLVLDRSKMVNEKITERSPLMKGGFYVQGVNGFERMDKDIFKRAIQNVFQTYPSAHVIDLVPDGFETERVDLAVEDKGLFKMSYEERALFLAEAFSRNNRMVGFRFELHDVGDDKRLPSVSYSVYLLKEDLEYGCVPLTGSVRFRRI